MLNLQDIPEYSIFTKMELIDKGWSGDKKFYIETDTCERLLLRIADISKRAQKQSEYDMLKRVAALDIPAPRPINFGVCNEGKSVYQLLTWVDGEDLSVVLPKISGEEQYLLGVKAGALQRRLHTIPVQNDFEDWSTWYGRRVQEKLELYFAYEQELSALKPCVDYLMQQKDLLLHRPQTFHHGDFNPTNIVLMPEGELAAIDFNDCGRNGCDPVWEFCTIPYGQNPNAFYYTGLLNGYYDGEPPQAEFAVLAYYFAWEALYGMVDARVDDFMAEDSRRHMENVLEWYDNMRNVVPSWYMASTWPE